MAAQGLDFQSAIKLIKDGQAGADHCVAQLLSSLTTTEKLSMLTGPMAFWPGLRGLMRGSMNDAPYLLGPLERLGIPGLKFCDGPRGVVVGKATCFPVAIARGATWDVDLERRVGEVIATESRAFGANMSGSVCINLPRHPAWGRIQETYGEDPVILGEFAIALSKSLQDNGVMACVKHFALNSMEDMRFKVDVKIDDVALHEVFLAHFEMAVREGPAMSIMSAYNKMNGEWCGQNDVLLNKILRDEWGFKYFVISDWVFGLRDSVRSLKNGLDMEAPFAQIRSKLQHELDNGEITIEEVDRSVTRLLLAQLELYSRRTTPDPDKSVILCQKHRDLSREVAARSMVLLKNEPVDVQNDSEATRQPLLPIDPTKMKKCAMIGHLADAMNTGDWGSSYVSSPHVVNPYEGMKSAMSGYGGTVSLTTTDDVRKAENAARDADFAIVVVGYGANDEGENLNASTPLSLIPLPSLPELVRDVPLVVLQQIKERLGFHRDGPSLGGKAGGDRKSVRLTSKNVNLIRAVKKANPRTVVAIVTSGAVVMEDWIDDADTVLVNWYSGCEGGDALTDVIFGKVDASGRLPFSIPRDEEDLPSFDATATSVTYDKWFGQRLIDRKGVTARFPLGYGCSYTQFSMENLRVEQGDKEALQVRVEVTNIGSRAGRHVVQVYGLPKDAGNDFPTRVLLGFASVDLQTKETKSVSVRARTRPLHRWQNGSWVPASLEVDIEVGSYAGDRILATAVQL